MRISIVQNFGSRKLELSIECFVWLTNSKVDLRYNEEVRNDTGKHGHSQYESFPSARLLEFY